MGVKQTTQGEDCPVRDVPNFRCSRSRQGGNLDRHQLAHARPGCIFRAMSFRPIRKLKMGGFGLTKIRRFAPRVQASTVIVTVRPLARRNWSLRWFSAAPAVAIGSGRGDFCMGVRNRTGYDE